MSTHANEEDDAFALSNPAYDLPAIDPWAHDPEVCGTMDCPGCYAAAYVPRRRQTLAEHLDEVYATPQPSAEETGK